MLVTSNGGFAQAAFEYGKDREESREVSSVITDFSLANMAWLKAPLGAPDIPMTEVISFSYAALQPSKRLLDKFLDEIEKLEQQGTITERDHQLLRSSHVTPHELMNLTLGEDDALTNQTVTETLNRIKSEITKEENEKYQAEQAAHRETQAMLSAERASKRDVQERIFWRCFRKAKRYSWAIAVLVGVALVGGVVAGIGVTSSNKIVGWILSGLFGLATLASVVDLLLDFSVRGMREKLERWIRNWMLRRQAAYMSLDLEDAK